MDERTLSTLYHQGKAGGIYSWRVWTEGADILTEYGLVNGEKQIARKTATPKNVGRSNATTAEEQAVVEAKAMWQNKRDRRPSFGFAYSKSSGANSSKNSRSSPSSSS